jgi:hypothetical protein
MTATRPATWPIDGGRTDARLSCRRIAAGKVRIVLAQSPWWSRLAGKVAGVTAALSLLAAGSAARANGAGSVRSELVGQVVVSDVLLAPGLGTSSGGQAALQRFGRHSVSRISGFWRLHMVAFLAGASAPGSDMVSLVAYDVTTPGDRHQVRVFEVPLDGGSHTVQINDFVVSEEMGFQAGHRYELVVQAGDDEGGSAAPQRKPDVLAKGVVTLR